MKFETHGIKCRVFWDTEAVIKKTELKIKKARSDRERQHYAGDILSYRNFNKFLDKSIICLRQKFQQPFNLRSKGLDQIGKIPIRPSPFEKKAVRSKIVHEDEVRVPIWLEAETLLSCSDYSAGNPDCISCHSIWRQYIQEYKYLAESGRKEVAKRC